MSNYNQSYDVVLVFPPIRTWDSPRNFPTGIGLIAARLRGAGYRVGVIDANALRLNDEQVLAEIADYNPAVVGFGGLITTYGWVKRIAGKVRAMRGDIKIMLGGSVGSSIVETALSNLDIDVITVGEADDTVLELMKALLGGGELDGIAGLAFMRGGQVVRTAKRDLIEDISKLDYPAWDMFPMEVYLENPVVGIGRDIDIISSRGCSFDCNYCYKIFGRRYRKRSATHVVGEMVELKRRYDVDFISFQDDCFVIDKKRVYAICDLIDQSSELRDIRWSCNGRVTVCDAELVRRMRTSGCVSVAYGIESGSQTMLRAMNKQVTLEQVRDTLECSRAAGLRTPLAFMIGYPGETRETVMETVAFCKQLNIPLTSMTFTCPYPGTALYEWACEAGKLPDNEEELVLKMGDAVDLAVNLTEMPDEELISLREEALSLARENYVGPAASEIEAHEKELFGEKLYCKSRKQFNDPRMRAHRQRHGFNDNSAQESAAAANGQAKVLPGWASSAVRPYVIAEAGVNHNGKLDLALEMVNAAASSGADCVKFQAFTADELVTREAPKAAYQQECGDPGESQYEMLRRYEMSLSCFSVLKRRCGELGIDFLATPFSTRWVDALVNMSMTAIKVGSGNIGAGSLLDTIGQSHLPVLLSTGMCTMEEVDHSICRLRAAGCGPLAVLHCVSLYPTQLEQVNLGAIGALRDHTGLTVGFSDHTCEVVTGSLAVAAGAVILEKHFTLDKSLDGPDHKASLTPEELREYINLARQSYDALGNGRKEPLAEELPIKALVRMSLVSGKFIRAGSVITREMLMVKRPGTGIPEGQLDDVVGSRAKCDIPVGRVLTEELLEDEYTSKPRT